jgi:hypothetical protein
MHKANELTCWNTPLTNACFVVLTSLVHEGSLTITFRADFKEVVSLVSFCFKQPCSYELEPSDSHGDRTGFTFKQHRNFKLISEGVLFNLKWVSRFAAAMYEQSEPYSSCDSEFDRYLFVLEKKTIEVFSTELPDVRIIASQLKLAS